MFILPFQILCIHKRMNRFKFTAQWYEKLNSSFLLTRWLNFEKVISALLSKKVYHLNFNELLTYARDNCFIKDEEEFTIMVDFYHDLGIIIKHCSTVILSAEWLIDLFKQLITIPPFDETVRSEIHSVGVLEPHCRRFLSSFVFIYLPHSGKNKTKI